MAKKRQRCEKCNNDAKSRIEVIAIASAPLAPVTGSKTDVVFKKKLEFIFLDWWFTVLSYLWLFPFGRWRPCWDLLGRADSLGCANTARECSATSSTWSSTSSTCTRWAGSSPARSARRRWRTSGIWGDTMSPTTGRPLRSERKIEITWGGNIPTTCCTTHSDYPGRNWFLSIELPPKTRENSPQCNRVPTTWVRSLYSTV